MPIRNKLIESREVRALLRRIRRISVRLAGAPYRRPNFLIIGAGKSGTTSLHNYLMKHPQVFVPTTKEANFFAFWNEDTSLMDRLDQEWVRKFDTTLNLYLDRFLNATNEIAVGEASPMYLYHPRAAEKIASVLPDVRIIAILREPLECAYSGYRMMVRQNIEKRSFLDAVADDEKCDHRYLAGSYLQKNCFAEQITRYFQNFASEQVRVYIYEDFVAYPQQTLNDMLSFLGVEEQTEEIAGKVFNSAPTPTVVPEDVRQTLKAWNTNQIEQAEEVLGKRLPQWRQKLTLN